MVLSDFKKHLPFVLGLLFYNTALEAQTYNMGNQGTISTCSGTFYDSGGPSGNYGVNDNFTVTFCSSSGQPIWFLFSQFNLGPGFGVLTIYDGPNTGSPQIGAYTGTNNPGTVTSTNISNCLTFRFQGGGFLFAGPGWTASVNCGTPPPPPTTSADCATAQPFCTGTNYNFPAATNTTAETGPNYGCLLTQPNPVWYYFQIDDPGNLDVTLTNSNNVDVDFICWGPFSSLSGVCTQLTSGNTVDCSYSTAATEYINISGAQTGQYYMLCITNYSNQPTNFVINTDGTSTASTNCAILCNISAMTATPGACNPLDNLHTVTGTLTVSYPPASGTLTVSTSSGQTITLNAPFSTSVNYSIPGINSTGGTITVTAQFSTDSSCNFSTTYQSPVPCTCTAIAGNNGPLCAGSSATLTGNTLTGATYQWSGPNGYSSNQQNPVINNVTTATTGIYTLTVTQGGCTATDTTLLEVVAAPSVAFTTQNVTCAGGSDGAITANGSPAGVSYVWNNGSLNPAISGLTAGTYVVTVSLGSCSVSGSASVTEPSTLVLGTPSITDASCTGGGSITANASGGTGTLVYGWSNGQSGNTITNLTGGTYQLTVTDQNLCTASATYVVGAAPDAIVFGAPVVDNVTCFGGNDGAISVSATGGSGIISFSWSNLQSGATISALTADTYSVTVSDANNCTNTITVVVTEPTEVIVTVPDVTIINCSGTGTGSLVATVTGGTYPYSYSWNSSPIQSDSTLDNVPAGTYTVVVSSTGGCTVAETATLNIQAGGNTVAFGTPVISDVLCHGENNGSIVLNVTGGSGIYSYNWSNGNTAPSSNTLVAGTYNITVDDGAGCTASASYTISEPAMLLIDSSRLLNVGCDGNLTGSITIFPSGGTAPLGYTWVRQSNGQTYTGQNLSGLPADTYSLTITDYNNCSVTASYTITQAVALVFSQSSTNTSCNGGSDGTATITITSGTPPYTYNWNNFGPTSNSTLTGIPAGVANVTITDANCSATATFTITEPSPVQINLVNQSNVSCAGGTDATITVSATGGTTGLSGYTYLWSNLQSAATANNLSAGVYQVTVADENSCTATQSYTVTEPTAIAATFEVADATCYDASNGYITASPSGGTVPYSFLWSDGQSTSTAYTLHAGTYNCLVTDNNGCTAVFSNTVGEPADLVISTSVTAVRCVGDANGTISVTAIGGTSPYNFSATQDGSNFVFATNNVIEGLAVGTYQVVVSDDNGCTKVVLATIPNATLDNFSTATDSTSCYGDEYNDGAAFVVATSIQNGPYEYSIDGGLYQYSGDFYNLSAGEHTVTAVNQFGCVTNIPVYVFTPLPIVVDVVPDTLLLPLGESGSVLVNYLNASDVSYAWTPSFGLSCSDCPNPTVSNYQMADYVVTVSMQNGSSVCFGSATLHVDVLPHEPVFIPNSFSPNGDGNNDLFMVYGADLKTVDMKIFNRWGELVYATNNAFQGWDGTYKGQLQLPQVFTYTVQVTFLDDKRSEKKGSIMLLR